MDDPIRSRRWMWACGLVAALALGGLLAPRVMVAQQPRPHLEYTHVRSDGNGLRDRLNKLDADGWEVFQVVPEVYPPKSIIAESFPHYVVIARRPAK